MDVHDFRMCLVKILLRKIQWDKTLVKEKEYIILFNMLLCTASLKTLLGKTEWDKNHSEGKKSTVNIYSSPSFRPSFLRRRNPIFRTSGSKTFVGNDFVKRSAKFSHERIFSTFISPSFMRS